MNFKGFGQLEKNQNIFLIDPRLFGLLAGNRHKYFYLSMLNILLTLSSQTNVCMFFHPALETRPMLYHVLKHEHDLYVSTGKKHCGKLCTCT